METNTLKQEDQPVIATAKSSENPPKSLEEQAAETGGTVMLHSQTLRHDH